MAFPTSELADVQISISFWRRSSSVMMPRLNWASAFWPPSQTVDDGRLVGGVLTSSMEMVSPDCVAYRKH